MRKKLWTCPNSSIKKKRQTLMNPDPKKSKAAYQMWYAWENPEIISSQKPENRKQRDKGLGAAQALTCSVQKCGEGRSSKRSKRSSSIGVEVDTERGGPPDWLVGNVGPTVDKRLRLSSLGTTKPRLSTGAWSVFSSKPIFLIKENRYNLLSVILLLLL